jgi:hypothetical protein
MGNPFGGGASSQEHIEHRLRVSSLNTTIMNYTVVYDTLQQAYDWTWASIGVVGIVVGVIAILAPRLMRPPLVKSLRYTQIVGSLILAFACVWTIAVLAITRSTSTRYQTVLQEGRYRIVEGTIQDFVPMPPEGHALEHFTVNGVPFAYSDFVHTGAFNQTSTYGGPIRPGLNVRIYYVNEGADNNRILQLAIKE